MDAKNETAPPDEDLRDVQPDAESEADTEGDAAEVEAQAQAESPVPPPAEGEDAPVETAEDGEPEAEPDLETLKAEAARAKELDERLLRVEAEFMNETRRIRRNAQEDRKYAIERVVIDLLPVIDALHSARDGLGEGEAADRMREGLDLVEKQLTSILERHGVERIEALGRPFDPSRHQAMMVVERPDLEPQTVCEVVRPGYELNGRVVRPVEVVVVKAPPPPETPDPDEPAASEDAGESGDAPAREDD